jgi:hypothetical protein
MRPEAGAGEKCGLVFLFSSRIKKGHHRPERHSGPMKGQMNLLKADLASEPPRPIHINVDAIAFIDPFGSATRTSIMLLSGKELKVIGGSETIAAQAAEVFRQSRSAIPAAV